MINLNKILLVGNLGSDPEVHQTEKGNSVATLSLATNRNFNTPTGERKTETQWHRAKVWGKKAEECAKKLRKGSKVFVEGEIQFRTWTDKDGIERKSTEIIVDDLIPLARLRVENTEPDSLEEEISA